jgi:hypothetical protein
MEEVMKYKVYHADEPTFGFGGKPTFPEDYTLVATVECKDEEDVFRATNHIDSDWTQNTEIVELHEEICRSTSVGDVVVDEDNVAMYCAPVGWEDMGKVEIC